jgi:hypothetical protein
LKNKEKPPKEHSSGGSIILATTMSVAFSHISSNVRYGVAMTVGAVVAG